MSVEEDSHDWAMLHYATGIMLGIAHKHGNTDVTIYHNGVRVRIEQVKHEDDTGAARGGEDAQRQAHQASGQATRLGLADVRR